MKIAFVYDRVNKFGGAERVLLALHKIWPEAPLYTAVYNKKTAPWADEFRVIPSFLNKLPFSSTNHEIFPLLTPYAFESFDFSPYDVVLSITSSDAKSIITSPKTLHICYMLTPTRYLWDGYQDHLQNPGFGFLNPFVKIFMKIFSPGLRQWDYYASNRVDKYIAISKTVSSRIQKYYGKEAEVLYPPVDTDKFNVKTQMSNVKTKSQISNRDYFLIVSRLVPYKRIDYAIEAFNELGLKLIIIGKGIDEKRLKDLAKSNIEFIDSGLTDEKLCWYYQNCKALIFPGREDFGISAVEVQSCGKPVIGVEGGGLDEIVSPGISGEIYQSPDKANLICAVRKFSRKKYLVSDCCSNAQRFSQKKFQHIMQKTIEDYWSKWIEKNSIKL